MIKFVAFHRHLLGENILMHFVSFVLVALFILVFICYAQGSEPKRLFDAVHGLLYYRIVRVKLVFFSIFYLFQNPLN